eukprot:CAMPEP_0197652030 /NCGR_PEP_ID=MMETSP1338-20131121/34201_1 /TAXON_ID=43686 ORGANISM="Pelagodinium beii, Strain RCC1491" /NCGR_SAMPLE_ID=MMETSP1338 /ASSEMBLY_ACC=CAM_ASM_000754 /LENGTH=235 /DNA_ID=CAMNT_0043226815 /DNA_START=32 /DNA_END=739 /DNA_ORIENTATION=-
MSPPKLPVTLGRESPSKIPPPLPCAPSAVSTWTAHDHPWRSARSFAHLEFGAERGHVVLAMHIAVDDRSYQLPTEGSGVYVLGDKELVMQENRDWLKSKTLKQLFKDIKKLQKIGHFDHPEPHAFCPWEKHCSLGILMLSLFCLALTGLLHLLEDKTHGARMIYVTAGIVFLTIIVFFCCNFRRQDLVHTEVDEELIRTFALTWSERNGFTLEFKRLQPGPSIFVLSKAQAKLAV